MPNILLLEDDRALSDGIKIVLETDSIKVFTAYSQKEARQILSQISIDLFLLDINLPDGSGLDFCAEIRKTSDSPVIFITANDTELDMLTGFSVGCDDYIAKPFSVSVLRQKVLAILKRSTRAEDKNTLTYRALTIDFDKMCAYKNGVDCRLTATEYRLLEYMAKNKGKVLTRNMLLEQIWDIDGNFVDENTLSVHIRRLRSKLGDESKKPEYIITVFGIGYTFGE